MERLAGKIILLWGWRRALAAFLAGVVLVLTQAPYDFFAAGFVAFSVLVWLLDGATADRPRGLLRGLRPAFATGYWFGLGYFVAGLWWIGAAFLVDAESYAWALPIGVLGLPVYLSLFYGLAAALARLFWSDGIGRIAALAAAFGVAEWLRGFVLTGFPWNAVGYGVMPVPLLMQPVQAVGMTGMNVLAVFAFSLPALLAGRRHLASGLAALLVLAFGQVGFGYYRMSAPEPAGRQLDVRILQTGEDQAEKWNAERRQEIFRSLLEQTAAPSTDGKPRPMLILWPETTVPYLLTQDGGAVTALAEALTEGQTLIAGAVRVEGAQTDKPLYYNSAIAIDDRGEIVDAVDKVHLVPGGEYLPLESIFAMMGIEQIVAGPNNFEAGAARHPIPAAGVGLVPFICYEVIFGEELYRDVRSGDVLVNLTNDGWFGDTPGPYQHFRQAQVRAVENGMPLLRSANGGISAAVDSRGRIVDAFRLDAAGVLDATITVPNERIQAFGNPQINGLGLLGAFALLALGLHVRHRLRTN
ncbi:MAG: apolipoprotein N-acyltransferase [Rhizobiaceae bacterium]|nr:apolipoprotein N-acyltransferase [Rhizobiaceae bacterium]